MNKMDDDMMSDLGTSDFRNYGNISHGGTVVMKGNRNDSVDFPFKSQDTTMIKVNDNLTASNRSSEFFQQQRSADNTFFEKQSEFKNNLGRTGSSSDMSEDSTDLMHGLGSGIARAFEENVVIYKGNLEESKQLQIISQLQDPLKDSDLIEDEVEMDKQSDAFK